MGRFPDKLNRSIFRPKTSTLFPGYVIKLNAKKKRINIDILCILPFKATEIHNTITA